jgi:transcriptional regulator, lysR family
MDLKQLDYFKKICTYKHLTKASEALFVSQPYLSALVAKLEKELDCTLFIREKSGLRLTKEGELLLSYSERVFSELDNLGQDLKKVAEEKAYLLRLSSENSIFIDETLREFISLYPDIALRHLLLKEDRQLEKLRSGELDFAIVTKRFPSEDFSHIYLREDAYVLLVSKNHPLAAKATIFLHEVADEPFLGLPLSENYNRLIDKIAPQAGFSPRIIFEGETHLLEKLCDAMNAFLVHLKSQAIEGGYGNLHSLELQDSFCKIDVYLVWYRHRKLSLAAEKYLEYMKRKIFQSDVIRG